jgi:hypothetical protein
MSNKQTFRLVNDRVRANAIIAIRDAPNEYRVTIAEPARSSDQNAKFHALCRDIARSGFKWAGKVRNSDEWKAILISGHAVATGYSGEVIPGIEGEFVAIRESSARMNVSRAASLITYVLAFCDGNGIPLTETIRGGFYEEAAA